MRWPRKAPRQPETTRREASMELVLKWRGILMNTSKITIICWSTAPRGTCSSLLTTTPWTTGPITLIHGTNSGCQNQQGGFKGSSLRLSDSWRNCRIGLVSRHGTVPFTTAVFHKGLCQVTEKDTKRCFSYREENYSSGKVCALMTSVCTCLQI